MQFCDLNRQYAAYKTEIDAAIQEVINSGQFINGSAINCLEENLSNYLGVKHSIACSSGSDAILLSLMALNVQPGDEIICPAFSFIASASMIRLYKAIPVFVDVSPVDFNLDPAKIEKKITSKTKGIVAVSLFGQCADMVAINNIAKKHNLWVLEDGAQSFGASYNEKKSGNLSDIAVTSFFPAKPLGCYGDGGAVFTNDDELAERVRMMRSHGQEKRYHHKYIGINGRIDTIQAAILNVKLKYFDKEVANRQKAADLYTEKLDGTALLPEVQENRTSVWAQYTICVENRDELRTYLQKNGIPTAVHYPIPLPKQKAFSDLDDYTVSFPVSELLSETVLSLPMHGLITSDEIALVSNTIKAFFNGKG